MHLVCALEFERSALAALARRRGWTLHCCGPRAAGVERWAGSAAAPPDGATVVLAGVAGATSPIDAGHAVAVATVVDGHGGEWAATFGTAASRTARCLSAEAVLTSTEAKDRAARNHGADLVDLESAAFARAAAARGWRWAVVRGISDTVDETLPDGIGEWVDDRGRLRLWRVVRAIVARPSLLVRLRTLRARSVGAMRAVAAALDAMPEGGVP
jgi:adenosylhomocysteine nucleosidase